MANNKKKKDATKSVFKDAKLDKKTVKPVEINPDHLDINYEKINLEEIKEVVISEINTTENISKSNNETFFEKFEKTKKDFSKEKRKQVFAAKKNISTKFKSSSLSTKINDSRFLKISWSLFIAIGIFIIAYSSVVLGFLAVHFNGVSDSLSMWTYINISLPITQVSVISSAIALALIVVPYVYLIASWFVGINSVYKSVSFFIFNTSCLAVSILCFILIICTSSVVFNFVIGFKPIVA